MLEEASDYSNHIRTKRIATHRREEQKPKLTREGKTKMIIEQQSYETIPGGLYAGKITDIVTEEKDFSDNKGGTEHVTQLRYTVTLDDGTDLTAWSSMAFSQKSKLYKWASAIIFNGGAIPPDYILDTDTLMNKRIMVTVSLQPKKNAPGMMVNRIEDFNPMPQARPKQTAAPRAAGVTQPPAQFQRPADLAQAADVAMPEEPPEVPIEDLVAPI